MTLTVVIESLESLEVLDTLDAGMTAEAQPLVPEAFRAGYRCALRDVRDALTSSGAVAAPAGRHAGTAPGDRRGGR